jgi:hypothetical protein
LNTFETFYLLGDIMAIPPAALGVINLFDQWLTASTTLNFSSKNGRLSIENEASNQTKELRTQCYLVAVIMNVFASLFPSCCYGTAEIEAGGRIYYVARSEIKNVLACNENLPCNFESGKKNAEDLEVIALQYFSKKAFNPKTFASLVHTGVQMLGGIGDFAALLQVLRRAPAPPAPQGAPAEPVEPTVPGANQALRGLLQAAQGAPAEPVAEGHATVPHFFGAQDAMSEAFASTT